MSIPERLDVDACVGEICLNFLVFFFCSLVFLSFFFYTSLYLSNGSRLWVIIASSLPQVKANERQRKKKETTTTERACSFVTHQFEFHIASHHSPHNMNNMVDYYDLFDKYHDCIENLNKDQLKLKNNREN